jgi:hypothetical protein
MKIVLNADKEASGKINLFYLTIIAPDGEVKSQRLPLTEYLQIVAASNFKQRSRTNMLYYHAEAKNFAVIGTGNKNEHEQGFFVKYGDGGADVKPIAHLFKTQVFQLAEFLGVPEDIRKRTRQLIHTVLSRLRKNSFTKCLLKLWIVSGMVGKKVFHQMLLLKFLVFQKHRLMQR